jgi:3-deoxy-D-manno-octulosonic-acid transferase
LFAILRIYYTLFIILALPLIFARLLLRSAKLPAYRVRLLERLGVYSKPISNPNGIWIHAVSVGEVVAAVPLIKALQSKYTTMPITVTTMTPTGAQRVQQMLGNTVTHVYMPYDIPWCIAGFIKKVQPLCLIIMETELWPNLLNTCKSRSIPVIIANARLSDRSFPRYMRFRWFLKQMLHDITYVATQSPLDTQRFIQLGLDANKITTVGNLKFDVLVDDRQLQAGKVLKANVGTRLILVAASTHEGEEQQILQSFKQIQQNYPDCLLILIPRHPDRFNRVAEILTQQQVNFIRRSSGAQCSSDTAVLLGDTMGELYMYYAAADVAFVGGSLMPIGGHNLLEPAAIGVPCITGPNLENFKDIAKLLTDAGLLQIVQDPAQLAQQCAALFGDPDQCAQLGDNAKQIIAQNRGATTRTMDIIYQYLELHKYSLEASVTKSLQC